jgi:hypothetical protein
MENGINFDNIIGKGANQAEEIENTLDSISEKWSKRFSKYEIEKTEEDIEIINTVESFVDQIVSEYGGDEKKLPIDKVHIVRDDSIFEIFKGGVKNGVHLVLADMIAVEKRDSKITFACNLAHEMFHLKSFTSLRVEEDAKDVRPYRSGLSMYDRKDLTEKPGEEKVYFDKLEEAIVARCTEMFISKNAENEIFKEELEAVEKIKELTAGYYLRKGVSEENIDLFKKELRSIPNPVQFLKKVLSYSDSMEIVQAYAAGALAGKHSAVGVDMAERHKERELLDGLLEKILNSSGGKFKNKEEVFNEFAKANFSGNYLPLARIIEDSLGKGSFRKIADEFSVEPGKKKDNFWERIISKIKSA